MNRARVLLVDDNDDFLDGIVDWLARFEHFEIVGRAHSGRAALERIEALGPDLVLMDVTLPDLTGFEVARELSSRADRPLIVLLSFHDTQAARLEAWASGADGFVTKSETTTRLMPLVGDLLRERGSGSQEKDSDSVTPTTRAPLRDLPE